MRWSEGDMKIEFAIRKAPVFVIDPKQVKVQGLCRAHKKGPVFQGPSAY